MEIIHLYTPKRGVRFFAPIQGLMKSQLNTDKYFMFLKKETFLRKLLINQSEYDVVLVTAHGAEDSIIIPRKLSDCINHSTQYQRYIRIEDTDKFYNDFVFAVACSTAMEFGPKAVENGALSYLGYEVIIEQLFKVTDLKISKKVRNAYETIAKHIFVSELTKSFSRFINEFQTVSMLKQSFALNLEKQLINLFKMDNDEILLNFNYGIDKHVWEKERPKLKMIQLDFLNTINSHLVIVGDPTYIPMIALDDAKAFSDNSKNRIVNAKFADEKYQKVFLSKVDDALARIVS